MIRGCPFFRLRLGERAWRFLWWSARTASAVLWIGLAILPASFSRLDASATPRAGEDIPVLAYYYIWFDPESWDRAKRDLPLLGRYSSDDREVMRQHIRWAMAAGIDGFIVSWKDTDVLSGRLELLIEEAQKEEFKLAIIYQGLDFERKPIGIDQIAADLDQFRDRYAGEEVFDLFARPLIIWSGTWEYTRAEIAEVTASRRGDLLILGSERNASSYQHIADLVDGDAYYWSSVNPDTYPGYPEKLQEMGELVHANGGLWIAPAAPGFDARLIGGERVVEREGGAMFEEQFRAAISSSPDAIGLISWNEFTENSHVEPSCVYGVRSLEVLARLKYGMPPTVVPDCDTAAFSAIQASPLAGSMEPLGTPATADDRIPADFDSSSPGGTDASPYGLIVVGALGGAIATSLVVLVRRAHMQSESP